MATLIFHLDIGPRHAPYWWVESPELPTLFVSSLRLAECLRLAMEALAAEDIDICEVRTVLVDAD